MKLSDIKFDINEVIKMIGLASAFIALRYDIVNEIRSNKVMDSADKQIIEYRLRDLEKRCKELAFLKPEETTVPTYRAVK